MGFVCKIKPKIYGLEVDFNTLTAGYIFRTRYFNEDRSSTLCGEVGTQSFCRLSHCQNLAQQ